MAVAQVTYDCGKGCMECNSQYGCVKCYKQYPVKLESDGKWKCGSPSICTIYKVNQYEGKFQCERCDDPYTLIIRRSSEKEFEKTYSCEVNSRVKWIDGCQAAEDNRYFDDLVTNKCILCKEGYQLSSSQKECLPISKPAKGVAWKCIYTKYKNGRVFCDRCEPGYSVVAGFCVSTPPEMEGCLNIFNDGMCDECNYYEGWFNANYGSSYARKKCTKV